MGTRGTQGALGAQPGYGQDIEVADARTAWQGRAPRPLAGGLVRAAGTAASRGPGASQQRAVSARPAPAACRRLTANHSIR